MLKIIGLAAVVLVAAVLVLAAMRPDEFRVQRSAAIQAPPEKMPTPPRSCGRLNTAPCTPGRATAR